MGFPIFYHLKGYLHYLQILTPRVWYSIWMSLPSCHRMEHSRIVLFRGFLLSSPSPPVENTYSPLWGHRIDHCGPFSQEITLGRSKILFPFEGRRLSVSCGGMSGRENWVQTHQIKIVLSNQSRICLVISTLLHYHQSCGTGQGMGRLTIRALWLRDPGREGSHRPSIITQSNMCLSNAIRYPNQRASWM